MWENLLLLEGHQHILDPAVLEIHLLIMEVVEYVAVIILGRQQGLLLLAVPLIVVVIQLLHLVTILRGVLLVVHLLVVILQVVVLVVVLVEAIVLVAVLVAVTVLVVELPGLAAVHREAGDENVLCNFNKILI